MLGQLYTSFYMKPNIRAATDRALDLAEKHGISGHATALRWTIYHSKLATEFCTAITIATLNPGQLFSNFDMIEQGPLPEDVVGAVEGPYSEIEGTEMAYHVYSL